MFIFLEAYRALQSYVEELDYTSDDEINDDDEDENVAHDSGDDNANDNDISFRDRRHVALPRNIIAVRQGGRVSTLSMSPSYAPHGGPLDRLLHTRNRRVSAALLSVCVLVLSLVGNVYRLQN